MNKVLKGLVAVAATAAMAVAGFAGASTATAVEGETATAVKTSYTISFPTDAKYQGHTYEVYQIFTGDFDGKVLSNVKYGKNGTKTAGTEVTAEELKQLTDVNVEGKTDQEKLDVIKTFAKLENPVATLTKTDTSYTAAPGYYLIKDKDGFVSGNDANTLYITKVVGDVAISPKSDVPSFEKKVKDTNDTTGETSDWQDSADYDFGDKVPFQLKATLPSNYADYKTYYLAFHDVEETGLSFNADSVKVAVDGKAVDAVNYTVKTTGLTDGCTFEVVFTDLKTAVAAAKAGSVITVDYTSTLTKQAVLGNQGNVNKAKLQFSNNPNSEQGGESTPTGETPWDNVIVFTYEVVVNKVNENKKALKGAAFKLEKKLNGGTTTPVKEFTAGEDTSFTFSGLDDGDYILTETATPAGYNTIKPITFTVTAEHNIEWTTGERVDVLTKLNGNAASGEITFTADLPAGSLTTNVVNVKGSNLPSTGGMGTVLLYVAGIAVFVLAGATLVMALRRRNA
ncbi:isopeptide-forming domain-containing fimbrial protein [Bifidobacterium adolescentis]|uniref:Isopeptide-forming domain-containing fimbrial protein n=1 Tax=Bifidobacterium adolescentis TaxID=1680 RepID=A0A6I0V9B8_BIFAD|nr:isopeptide-forming domain-containing fimbrial protein [Bifidobacterium adolescentis]KAB5970035.1 isopeptide-forming domain-containing fimbrial protein [Bifidobacterium adolescentis]KAB5971920.1 isopeptide-forming domain-containing fimbrial protein [Bifidobacterium adolescentis]KAB5973989.1 isopeptide-forming domain-containing fimbrial protein [Bifidobacterium adolescentis]KAB5975236.1 isopeptide-forming domain-containing fimbrial protein [Bifidobacterium adolescentis]